MDTQDRLTKAIVAVINTKRWTDMGEFSPEDGDRLLQKSADEAVAAGLSRRAADYLAGYAYPIGYRIVEAAE